MKGLITGPPKGGKKRRRGPAAGVPVKKNMSKVVELFDTHYNGKILGLPDAGGKEVDWRVIGIFRTDRAKEQRYIGLERVSAEEGKAPLTLYRFEETDDGPELESIVDAYELEIAANVLGEYLDVAAEEEASRKAEEAAARDGKPTDSCGG